MATESGSEQEILLRSETDEVNWPLKPVPIPVQTSKARHHPGCGRAISVPFADESLSRRETEHGDCNVGPAKRTSETSRLGIEVDQITSSTSPPRIRRVPVGAKADLGSQKPVSARSLMAPLSASTLSASTKYDPAIVKCYRAPKHAPQQSMSSLHSTNAPSPSQTSARVLLPKNRSVSFEPEFDQFQQRHCCHSARHFKRGMSYKLAVTIILLSIFSTFFSGAYVTIAFHKPRWGTRIGTHGAVTVSTAAFLTSLFAKMIELSFITVVVAFVGQLLARRAFHRDSGASLTLAEISMRSWSVQPGTMLTQWEGVKYAAVSWLGFLALLAAIMAMLYTPASTALVQPQLKFGKWEYRDLQGNVSTSFANEAYIESSCKTPITPAVDPDNEEITRTCIQLEHASESFHNYFRWISDWTGYKYSGEGSRYLNQRLSGWALFDNSIEMTAPWIEIANQGRWRDTDWFVNNITMAMPHPGVVLASQDPANGITQPEDLDGLGVYSVRASVPVPFINVICLMGWSANDLKPLVYTEWNNAEDVNIGTWPGQLRGVESYLNDPYLGGTPFDDIFEWGEEWGPTNFSPTFPKLPISYNTIANDTLGMAWGRKAVYLLLKGGHVDVTGQPAVHNYGLCELRVGQTPECSTRYNASSSVGTLEALCEDPRDDLRYIKLFKNASSSSASLSADWPNIGSMWLRSMQLNNRLIDGNASNARLLTELLLTNNSVDWSDPATPMALDPAFPSPAEALAVSVGCTLIQSALGGPFVERNNGTR